MNATLEPAVRCQALTKGFGDGAARLRAVDQVTVDVYPGELTLLVGPSGCGKTTLISLIAGLLDPSQGEVTIFGVNQARLSNRKRLDFRAKNIGFVFQQYNLLPALTAAENAAVPLLAAGVKRQEAVERAVAVLEELGMGARAQARPNELSGGQQQRVAIARALIHEPRLLVCDEPTAALDAESGHAVMELLKKAAVREDRAVVVVTHDSRVFHFGDRIAYMNDGRITKTERAGAVSTAVH